MNHFAADWLARREPFDRVARAASAAALDWTALADTLQQRRPVHGPVGVLDLACGTGANLRELAPRLGGNQRWLMVDHDPALLAALPAALSAWAGEHGLQWHADGDAMRLHGDGLRIDIECRCIDLAAGLGALPWREVQLVSASALLDLASAPWLQALVGHCRDAGAAVLWALSVDGRIDWSPRDPDDDAVQALFDAHQRRDKGLSGGPALGATAAATASALLAAAGYRVTLAPGDWDIDAAHGDAARAMLTAMIGGTAQAAAEQAPAQSSMVAAWRTRRLASVGRSRLRVGHQDLLALR